MDVALIVDMRHAGLEHIAAGAAYLAPNTMAAEAPATGVSVWLETSLKRVFPNTPRSEFDDPQKLTECLASQGIVRAP